MSLTSRWMSVLRRKDEGVEHPLSPQESQPQVGRGGSSGGASVGRWDKMGTHLLWKGPPQSWRANPMVMKTPRATPRLRGPQRRMVLVGDRGPMWHREGGC